LAVTIPQPFDGPLDFPEGVHAQAPVSAHDGDEARADVPVVANGMQRDSSLEVTPPSREDVCHPQGLRRLQESTTGAEFDQDSAGAIIRWVCEEAREFALKRVGAPQARAIKPNDVMHAKHSCCRSPTNFSKRAEPKRLVGSVCGFWQTGQV